MDDLSYLHSAWERVKRSNDEFWTEPTLETADAVISKLRDFLAQAEPYIQTGETKAEYDEAKKLLDQMDKAVLSTRWPLNFKDAGRVNGTFDHIQDLIHRSVGQVWAKYRGQHKDLRVPDHDTNWLWAA